MNTEPTILQAAKEGAASGLELALIFAVGAALAYLAKRTGVECAIRVPAPPQTPDRRPAQ